MMFVMTLMHLTILLVQLHHSLCVYVTSFMKWFMDVYAQVSLAYTLCWSYVLFLFIECRVV